MLMQRLFLPAQPSLLLRPSSTSTSTSSSQCTYIDTISELGIFGVYFRHDGQPTSQKREELIGEKLKQKQIEAKKRGEEDRRRRRTRGG